jgi:acyl-CoA thioesterase I
VSRFPATALFLAALLSAIALGRPSLPDPPSADTLPETNRTCRVPLPLSTIDEPLERTGSKIRAGKPVTIVAIGSSSTQGVGASEPAMSYPSRLQRELRTRYPGAEIRVINRGAGGQDVGEELARLDKDAVAENPDLVIWQLGTNAVLRREDLSADDQLIRQGVNRLKEHGIDAVLMDLQYAPRVLARPATGEMERLIAEVAGQLHVGLFRRFAIMRHWDESHQLGPAGMIGPDGLHMTDTSYGCLADQLAGALEWNWLQHAKLAKSPRRNPDMVAGVDRSTRPQPAGVLPPR